MARRDILQCGHEPFGDAFYFGPEFLSDRFRDDAAFRQSSEYSNTTFKDVLESLEDAEKEVCFHDNITHVQFHPKPI